MSMKINELIQVGTRTEEYEVVIPAKFDESGKEISAERKETRTHEVPVMQAVTRDATPEEERAHAEKNKKYLETKTYAQRVSEYIREKYSIDDELAILRQKDEKPEEYAEYYAYAEECKKKARSECESITQPLKGRGLE